MEPNCIACSKEKRRGVPPKTRWKEEQEERVQGRDGKGTEAQGKENRVVAAPSPGEATVVPTQGGSKPRCILEEIRKSAVGTKGESPKMPVACISGVPREPTRTGVVERVTPAGSVVTAHKASCMK